MGVYRVAYTDGLGRAREKILADFAYIDESGTSVVLRLQPASGGVIIIALDDIETIEELPAYGA